MNRISKEPDQFNKEIESVKTLRNRIRMELGLKAFVDDADAYSGRQQISLLVLIPKRGRNVAQKQVEDLLGSAGYKRTSPESNDEPIFWAEEKGQNVALLFYEAREFLRRVSQAELLTKLFNKRPDYVFIAESISKHRNSAIARRCFSLLACDECFLSKTFGKERRTFGKSEVAAKLRKTCNVDILVRDLQTYITGSQPSIDIHTKDKEKFDEVNAVLQSEGFKYKRIRGDDESYFSVWEKEGAEFIAYFPYENLFKENQAKNEWCKYLLTKFPDYALIAEMYFSVSKTGPHIEDILGDLARNGDFRKLTGV
jgi:hypothetical protein